jgi:general secretion pathway protein J
MKHSAHSKTRGFTLIELLVALAIMAVVAVLSWRGLAQVLRARDVIYEQLSNETAISRLFDQLELDAHALAGDADVQGAAIDLDGQSLRMVRWVLLPGTPARMQVVRYRVSNAAIYRVASPLIATTAGLQQAIGAGGNESGWSSVVMVRGVAGLGVRVWLDGNGYVDSQRDLEAAALAQVKSAAIATELNAVSPNSAQGIEVSVAEPGLAHPLVKTVMVAR